MAARRTASVSTECATATQATRAKWISLDGIAFPKASNEGTPLALEPGWSGATEADGAEALEFARPSYTKVGGLCVLSGIVRSSWKLNGGTVATLPAECRPARHMAFADGFSPLSVATVDPETGAVELNSGGGSDWISLDGIVFVVAN